MLETYAAWLDATTESDLQAIRGAMEAPPASQPPIRAGAIAERVAVPLTLWCPHRSPRAVTALSLAPAPDVQLPDNWYKVLAGR